MALSASTIWEVETGGSDTLNGGAFDPSKTAGMFTDGAATVGNTSAPVFTSASYNFVAGDVGAWVYIASGSNWTAGWYKIVSVAANAATLQGTIGLAVTSNMVVSTVVGCATVASPTGATWTIDYSQQAAAQFAYTDLASVGAGLLVSSVAKPFAAQQVGNSIVITGGTNFTAGRYVIASVAAGVATVVGAANITTAAGVSGTGGLGGALATIQQVNTPIVNKNLVCVQAGAGYTQSSNCTVASVTTTWMGYTTTRGDGGRATITAASGCTKQFNVSGAGVQLLNFNLDSATIADNCIIGTSSEFSVDNCICQRFKVRGIDVSGAGCAGCNISNTEVKSGVSGCTAGIAGNSGSAGSSSAGLNVTGCYVHDSPCLGISAGMYANITDSVIANNTGASSDGISQGVTYGHRIVNCSVYGNGRDGYRSSDASGANYGGLVQNCIFTNNGGYGINIPNNTTFVWQMIVARNNAFYNNTSGANNLAAKGVKGTVTLTGDPFTSAAGGDFSLNNTAGAGASCRAAGIGPFGQTGYVDIGAVQHADPGGGFVPTKMFGVEGVLMAA